MTALEWQSELIRLAMESYRKSVEHGTTEARLYAFEMAVHERMAQASTAIGLLEQELSELRATRQKFRRVEVLSIDAWRTPDGGWAWNDSRRIDEWRLGPEEGDINPETRDVLYKPRALLKRLRDYCHLTARSIGTVGVEYFEGDPTVIEVQDRSTREPLIALRVDWGDEELVYEDGTPVKEGS